jgi:hypothetical protein
VHDKGAQCAPYMAGEDARPTYYFWWHRHLAGAGWQRLSSLCHQLIPYGQVGS